MSLACHSRSFPNQFNCPTTRWTINIYDYRPLSDLGLCLIVSALVSLSR